MAVTLNYSSVATVRETISSGADAATNSSILHDGFDESGQLTGSTTPPVTKCVYRTIALSGGAYTIDLTTITGTNGAVQDGTGLKVQYFRVKNLGDNAMTFSVGASNGYDLAGASFSVTLAKNQFFDFFGNDATPDIAAADRTIDVAGSGTQTFELSLTMG